MYNFIRIVHWFLFFFYCYTISIVYCYTVSQCVRRRRKSTDYSLNPSVTWKHSIKILKLNFNLVAVNLDPCKRDLHSNPYTLNEAALQIWCCGAQSQSCTPLNSTAVPRLWFKAEGLPLLSLLCFALLAFWSALCISVGTAVRVQCPRWWWAAPTSSLFNSTQTLQGPAGGS